MKDSDMTTATMSPKKEHAVTPAADATRIPVNMRSTTLRKHPDVVGVITAAALVKQYDIPRRDHKTKTGYQREVAVARVNKLVDDLKKKRVDLPTAVLLNLRDYDK